MTYCALARRANGLFYYCYDDRAWKMTDHPTVWELTQPGRGGTQPRLPLFEAAHLWWPYIHEFPTPSTGFNSALESSVKPALLRVRSGNTKGAAVAITCSPSTTRNETGLPYDAACR